LLSAIIGIPLGIFAATHQYKVGDSAAVFISLLAVSMPSFWFALLLVQLLAVKLMILPVSGVADWKGWIMPILSISLGYIASITRQMRSDILEIVRQDFITTARSKGLSERKVLYKHALKNALIPVVQIIGGTFGFALGGAIISEMVYSLPGLGSYTLTSLQNRDYPAIQGSVVFLSIIFCAVILLVDVTFTFIDPRIRAQFIRRKRRTISRGEA
jgi:peptide/nickel transport system permease protein